MYCSSQLMPCFMGRRELVVGDGMGANSVKIKRVVYINQENRGEILLE